MKQNYPGSRGRNCKKTKRGGPVTTQLQANRKNASMKMPVFLVLPQFLENRAVLAQGGKITFCHNTALL